MPQQYLSQEGLNRLRKELEYLKTVRRKELAEQLERAIGFGDISENAEFQEAKETQAFVEGRILELEEIIRSVEMLPIRTSKETAQVGDTVFVSNGKQQESFQIVGPEEANPMEGKISMNSPLGNAVINRAKGSEVTVDTPEGKKHYKIIKIA